MLAIKRNELSNHKKTIRRNLKCKLLSKRWHSCKGYLLHDSNYKAFRKISVYGESKRSVVARDLGEGKRGMNSWSTINF